MKSREGTVVDADDLMEQLLAKYPPASEMDGAIFRMMIEYPRELEPLIDENALRQAAESAFEFHLVKRPQVDARVRLPQDQALGSLTPLELLEIYWRTVHVDPPESEALQSLAKELLQKSD